jgi:hypothetical protein
VLGGFLARAGFSAPQVDLFASATMAHVGGPNAKDHARTARNAAEAHEQGTNVPGLPKLAECFGEKRAKRIAEWLGYKEAKGRKPRKDIEPEPEPEPPRFVYTGPPLTLDQVDAKFVEWLGESYDVQTLHAVLAAAASARLAGDPLWLLVIGGPGGTKTETASALEGAGAHIVSTIASEGALLSASSGRAKVKGATGGLLRQLARDAIVVIKEFGSILSMNGDARNAVLAALREVHDGRWVRKVGSDGGQSLAWEGRVVIIGAVTTAWDTAHTVVSRVGDRFVVVRFDTSHDRLAVGMQALDNVGYEDEMRRELRAVVAGLMLSAELGTPMRATEREKKRLVEAANLVTLARTAVDLDGRGNVDYAHDPEAPTRFAKQLLMVMRGAVAIGMGRHQALDLALRCARDSMPPLRRDIILDIAANPCSRPIKVRERLQKPYNTVDRQLQSLHMLGVLKCEEEEEAEAMPQGGTRKRLRRAYRLADGIEPTVLNPLGDQEELL